MQTTAADLRARIQDVNAGLNRVGKAYLHHLTNWQEHSSITSSLTHSVQVSMHDLGSAESVLRGFCPHIPVAVGQDLLLFR